MSNDVVLRLRPVQPADGNEMVRLRIALKGLLRQFRWRCVSAEYADTREPTGAAEALTAFDGALRRG